MVLLLRHRLSRVSVEYSGCSAASRLYLFGTPQSALCSLQKQLPHSYSLQGLLGSCIVCVWKLSQTKQRSKLRHKVKMTPMLIFGIPSLSSFLFSGTQQIPGTFVAAQSLPWLLSPGRKLCSPEAHLPEQQTRSWLQTESWVIIRSSCMIPFSQGSRPMQPFSSVWKVTSVILSSSVYLWTAWE